MDTLDRLESSVQRFLEAYRRLREERDNLSGELLLVNVELEQSRETARGLRHECERYAQADARYRDLDARKEELQESIRQIIRKIDLYSDTDGTGTTTNEQ